MKDLNEAIKLLTDSKRIMLVGSPKMTYDEVASLATLKLLFDDLGKTAKVYFSENFSGKRADLLERTGIIPDTDLDPLNYTISIPYSNGEVERVSYDSKDNHITLHITPGSAEFDFDSVKYAVAGSNFDVILVVGARKLEWLGEIYTKNKETFDSTKIIALNNLKGSQEFGDLKIVDEKKQTLSEIVYDMVSLLGGTQNELVINTLFEGVVAGADFKNKSLISDPTNTVIVNLLSAGADIKTALQNVYFDEEKAPEIIETTPEPIVEDVPIEKEEKLEQPELIKIAAPKKTKTPKRGKIGVLKKPTVTEGSEDIEREPSLGFIKPPMIEKTAKIPLGAPIKMNKPLKPSDET